MIRRFVVVVANPIQPMIESVHMSELLKNRILIAAITHDDPDPAFFAVLKQWSNRITQTIAFLISVQQPETSMLTMEMKNRSRLCVTRIKGLRRCKVVGCDGSID